jgi:hypothetical protein
MTKDEKIYLLGIYTGRECPACGGTKNPTHWTCIPCGEFAGSEKLLTKQWLKLARKCQEHLEAAKEYIEFAKMRL